MERVTAESEGGSAQKSSRAPQSPFWMGRRREARKGGGRRPWQDRHVHDFTYFLLFPLNVVGYSQ